MKRALLSVLPFFLAAGHAGANQNTIQPPPVTQFTQEDIESVSPPGLSVEVPTNCPKQNDDQYFANYPLSIARDHGGGSCSRGTTWSGLITGVIWTNRCTTAQCGHRKPNGLVDQTVYGNEFDGQSNLEVRLLYSSIGNANAATLAELDWWLGGTHWLTLTEGAGIPDDHVYTCIHDPCKDGTRAFMDDVNDGNIQLEGWSPSGNAPWVYVVPVDDYVVMPLDKLTDDPDNLQTYVVEMDYERADGIGDTGTVAFLTEVDQLLQNTSSLGPNELPHTYMLNIWDDELVPYGDKGYDHTNTWKSGLDASSIPQIMALPGFNYYSVMLWSKNRFNSIETSWEQALSVVNGGTEPGQCSPVMQHVMMVFELADTALSDAQTANNLLASWCVPAVEPWFNGAILGGPDCYGDQQLLWPAKWGDLIGLPTNCDKAARILLQSRH
jgi:hypothetical protein